LNLVAPLTLRAKVVYKAVQRGCVSSVDVTIVNAGAVYLIDLLPFLHLSSLLVRPPRLVANGACSKPRRAPVADLEERL
jgi:hypothetical protein